MQTLWSSIRGPVEQREDAVHVGGLQRGIMMQEFHVRAAMIDRVAFVAHDAGSPRIEPECRMSEISCQNLDTTLIPERRKLSLVERLPQSGLGRSTVDGADVAGDLRVGLLEQRGKKMAADEAGGPRQENARGFARRALAGRLDVRRQVDVPGQIRGAVRSSIEIEQRREVPDDGRRIDRRDREIRPDLVADASAEADRKQRMAAEIEEVVVDAHAREPERLGE